MIAAAYVLLAIGFGALLGAGLCAWVADVRVTPKMAWTGGRMHYAPEYEKWVRLLLQLLIAGLATIGLAVALYGLGSR